MTKAKELATTVLDNIEAGRSEWQEFRKTVWGLCDAVLSEPEEQDGLKGFIDVTVIDKEGEHLFGFLADDFRGIKVKENGTYIIVQKTCGLKNYYIDQDIKVKESYDEIKQKIKEAG